MLRAPRNVASNTTKTTLNDIPTHELYVLYHFSRVFIPEKIKEINSLLENPTYPEESKPEAEIRRDRYIALMDSIEAKMGFYIKQMHEIKEARKTAPNVYHEEDEEDEDD